MIQSYILQNFVPGDRVQLAPHHDLWMRGAKYGTVERIGRRAVHVRLDVTRRLARLSPEDIGELIL